MSRWLLFSLGLYLVWAYAPEGDSPLGVMNGLEEWEPEGLQN